MPFRYDEIFILLNVFYVNIFLYKSCVFADKLIEIDLIHRIDARRELSFAI